MLAAQVVQLRWGAKRKGRVPQKNKRKRLSRMPRSKLTVLRQQPRVRPQRTRAATVSRVQALREVLKLVPLWNFCSQSRRKTSSCS